MTSDAHDPASASFDYPVASVDETGRTFFLLAANDGHAEEKEKAGDSHGDAAGHDAEAAHGDEHAGDGHAAEAHGHDEHAGDGHGHDEHAGDEHGHDEHGHDHHAAPTTYRFPEEFPNAYSLATSFGPEAPHHHKPVLGGPFVIHPPFWLNGGFAVFYGLVFVAVVARIMRFASIRRPSRPQAAVEMLFSGLFDFFGDIFGDKYARKFVPFAGSMWIFILLCNLSGLVPFMKSPSAHFWSAAGLAFCTFCYVNYHAIKESGWYYVFHHLCGSPESPMTWAFAPLIFVLELIGTFVKPLSLALRLSGNIFGEDKLLVAFLTFGMLIPSVIFETPTPMVGIPLHAPIMVLCTLFSVIQATVFSLLSAVYLALLLPHDHDHDEHGHGDHGHEGHGHGHAAHA